jgi:hypothetical protein
MDTVSNQLDADWVQALDQAESDIKSTLSQLPHDKVHEYTDDLQAWAKRVSDEILANRFRVLRNLGYSKASAVTALGISPASIYRIISDVHVDAPTPMKVAKSHFPEDYLDVTEDFQRLRA